MTRISTAIHERLSAEEPARRPPNVAVGLVLTALLSLVGIGPALLGRSPRGWAVLMAAALLTAALLFPRALGPLTRGWITLGLVLHGVISPVVMAVLYYTTITPLGLLLRVSGKDPLRLRLDRDATTYWIPRSPPGPPPETMRRQF